MIIYIYMYIGKAIRISLFPFLATRQKGYPTRPSQESCSSLLSA